jgi:hypothetical protein
VLLAAAPPPPPSRFREAHIIAQLNSPEANLDGSPVEFGRAIAHTETELFVSASNLTTLAGLGK